MITSSLLETVDMKTTIMAQITNIIKTFNLKEFTSDINIQGSSNFAIKTQININYYIYIYIYIFFC